MDLNQFALGLAAGGQSLDNKFLVPWPIVPVRCSD